MAIFLKNIKIFFWSSLFLVSNIFSQNSLEVLEVNILDTYQIQKKLPGKLLPFQNSMIAFEIPGKIEKVFVDVGDKVIKGDVLAKLDDREIIANLNQTKAKLDLAEQQLIRFRDLNNKGFISQQELDRAKSEVTVAKSQFDIAQVKQTQTLLVAPYDGFIQARKKDEGSVINSSIPIFEILDSQKVEAHISVPENLIKELSLNSKYSFLIDGIEVEGELSRLAPMSVSGSQSRLAIFIFSEFYTPGKVVEMVFQETRQASGTWVPINAMTQSDQGLWSVYTLSPEMQVQREVVEIVHYEDNYAYVSGTLKKGDLIILGGLIKVLENQILK